MKKLLLIIASIVLFTNCVGDDDSPSVPDINIAVNDIFSLAYSGAAIVSSEDLSIRFEDVEDSRCPTNLTCVTGGEAEVTLEIQMGSENMSLKLKVDGGCFEANNCQGESKEALGFLFQLISVDPHPIDDSSIDNDTYSVRLQVTMI